MRNTLWAIWLLVPGPFFKRLFLARSSPATKTSRQISLKSAGPTSAKSAHISRAGWRLTILEYRDRLLSRPERFSGLLGGTIVIAIGQQHGVLSLLTLTMNFHLDGRADI